MTPGLDHFGESVAATYGDPADPTFSPAAIEPAVWVLAELAGLRLRDRWAGWARAPFTSESRSHVSIWERAPDGGPGA